MDLKHLFKDKTFIFDGDEGASNDFEVVDEIIKFCKLGEISSVEFISANANYDCYKVLTNDQSYFVKYSLDSSYKGFENESSILNTSEFAWQPTIIAHGTLKFGDQIAYSVTSFEYAETINKSGRSVLVEFLPEFIENYFSLQNKNLSRDNINSFLSRVLSECSIANLPDEVVEVFKNKNQIEIINNITSEIKSDINNFYRPLILEKKELCHGNLNLENVLFRDGSFKFVNFTKCFTSNLYLDVASIVINFNLDSATEKLLVKSFSDYQDANLYQEKLEEYNCCYEIMIRVKALESLFDLIQESYSLESERPSKIMKIISSFSINSSRFMKIPTFKKHYEFIYSTILEPIIGSKGKGEDEEES